MTTVFVIVGPLLGTLLVLWFLSRQVVKSADEFRQADERDGRVEFTPNRSAIWSAILFSLVMGVLAVDFVIAGPSDPKELVIALFCVAIVAMILAGFPASISLGADAVEQTYWLRPPTRIAWSDVTRIQNDVKRNRVLIEGRGGKKIIHARQLPDKTRLLAELQKHCPGKMPDEGAKKVVSLA